MHIRLSREFIQRPLAGLYFSFLPLLCSLTPLFSFSLFIPSRCVLKGLARSKVLMARFIILNIPFSEWLFISILFKQLQTSQCTERDQEILTSVLYKGCHVFCQGESWDHESLYNCRVDISLWMGICILKMEICSFLVFTQIWGNSVLY